MENDEGLFEFGEPIKDEFMERSNVELQPIPELSNDLKNIQGAKARASLKKKLIFLVALTGVLMLLYIFVIVLHLIEPTQPSSKP